MHLLLDLLEVKLKLLLHLSLPANLLQDTNLMHFTNHLPCIVPFTAP